MDHLFVLIPLLLGILGSGGATPLDDYVNKPDPTYKYTILSKHKGVGYTLYTINMTSQTWKPSKYHLNYFFLLSSVQKKCHSIFALIVFKAHFKFRSYITTITTVRENVCKLKKNTCRRTVGMFCFR